MQKLLKLNLGCGRDYKEGFVNVDIRDGVGADLVHDIAKPFSFSSGSVSKIIAQDVFEHLTVEEQSSLLSEIYRLLAKGGKLSVRIPNNEDIWNRFSDDPDARNLFLFGDTSESGVWGSHKSGHTLNSFAELAALSGLRILKYSAINTNYEFEFIKDVLPKLKGVVLVTQSLSMGGAENGLAEMLSWLNNHKIPVTAWTTSSRFNEYLNSHGIKAKKIPVVVDVIGDWKGLVKGLLLFPFAFFCYGYIVYKSRNVGTIHLSGFIEKIMVAPWAKLMNVPVTWNEHGPLQILFSKFFGFPKLLYRLVSRSPNFVIVPSEHTRISNLNISGLSSAKTKVIPSGINMPKLTPSVSQKLTAYCVSRMEPGKGQDLLIKAWPKVLTKFPKARLYFTGEGDFQKKLEKQVHELNLDNSVTFLGWVNDLNKTVSPFSVAICPSVWPLEGFGLILVETMALGKPIICFKSPPYTEVVSPDCAIMVTKGDTQELANAIIRIFSHPELGKRLGENGKKRFKKFFTTDKISPRYGEVFLRAQIACQIKSFFN
jgi:glycosyltransferase involved in cell wall biosynthesis